MDDLRKWTAMLFVALLFLLPGPAGAQQLTPQQIENLRKLPPAQQMDMFRRLSPDQQKEALKMLPPEQQAEASKLLAPAPQKETSTQLSPAQQQAIAEELAKTGGTLTPEAMEALKSRPEFQGLTPEEIVKSRAILEKQEIMKKEAAKKEIEKAKVLGPPDKKEIEKAKVLGPPEKKPAEIKIEKAFEVEPAEAAKTVLGEEKPQSLYERSREIRKYQDIPLDLKPFGYDFFREAAVNVITQRRDIPIPLKYIVGPGDEVKILLWGRINASYTLTVDRDGKVTIPNLGPLAVAGMTFEQMSQFLIKQAQQITGTNVDVSMGALRTIPVFILGDVRRPGAYTIGAFATITDALLLAGGPTEIGTMRNIQLKRKDKVVQTLDLYDLLLKGDKSQDVILQAGDVVFVPVIGPYVGVAGNVRRPALYELKDNFSLDYLFGLAGGIIPTAYTQQIQVERTVKGEKKIMIDIDDKAPLWEKMFVLQDADLVKIFSIVERDANIVTLQGNVKRGGKYALKPGMRLGDILKDPQQDLLPETHFDYALIKRQDPPRMEPLLIPFNLGDLLLRKDKDANLELQPMDVIYVFSKWFFRDKPFFTVSGEVRKPGRFDLSENFRVKDAILAGGDLTKNAYLKKGEIVRVNKKKEYSTLYFDVTKAMADDASENLPLQDEDQIIIHSLYEEQWKEMVTVVGEVKTPGDIMLTERMRVSDLIFKAGGQTRDTLLDEAELYRTDWKTKEVTLRKINLAKALAGDPTENVELKDLDRLIVHSIWEKVYKANVIIAGEVKKPGTYEFGENMTVRDLVFAAGGETRDTLLDEAELYRTDWKTKEVTLRKVNLGKALAGDSTENVELKDLDRLIVHSIWEKVYKKTVSIEGDVLRPGAFPLADNMTVRDLVFAAGNVLESASLEEAEVSSQVVDQNNRAAVVHQRINLALALTGDPAHNLPLRPYDRVFIKRITDWNPERYVTLTGEFRYPGRYVIRKGEKLSSLVERAGGYKDTAYLRGTVFTRERVRDLQQKGLAEMADRLERELLAGAAGVSTALSPEEIAAKKVEMEQKQKFIDSLRKLKATGRMTVYLAHMRLLRGSEYDIEMEDGDTLFIPQRNSVVLVMGAVMTQGSHIYSEKMTYRDYINESGGFADFADADNVFVLKVDGSARKMARGLFNWSAGRNRWEIAGYGEEIKTIEPGDTIVVPEKIERIAWLRNIRDITQVLMNTAVTAGVVLRLF